MADITAIFWDVGGVLLTNGWDREARRRAAEKFALDREEFQERHYGVVAEFEKGRLGLDDYLECTVFHRRREFTPADFKAFMFSQSRPLTGSLELVASLRRCNRYLMTTLNNESHALNRHRIEQFNLREYFSAFFSSCFLDVRKPERRIYQAALQITQRRPEECLFVDDRPPNLEAAERLGLRTLHFRGVSGLRAGLAKVGVEAES